MNTMHTSNHRALYQFAIFAGALLVMLCSAYAVPADICIPNVGDVLGNPPTMDGKPQDDVGWNQAGQLGLGQIKWENGSATDTEQRNGNFQYGVKSNYLYFSVDLDNSLYPPDPSKTTVIIAFSPDGNPVNDWRLHITGFGGTNTTPTVLAWRGSNHWNERTTSGTCQQGDFGYKSNCNQSVTVDPTTGTVPAQNCSIVQPEGAQFRISKTSTTRWGIEARLLFSNNPADAPSKCKIYLPTAPGTFKAYFNVVSTNNLGFNYTEDPWPVGSTLVFPASGTPYIERCTPAPSVWGVASLDTSPPSTTRAQCTGVKITAAGVKTTAGLGTTSYAFPGAGLDPVDNKYYYLKDPDNSGSQKLKKACDCVGQINTQGECQETSPPVLNDGDFWDAKKSQTNTFAARVTNNGPPAPNVSANFYIAPWGLPGPQDWDLIGERYRPTIRPKLNPTSPPQSIGAASVDLTTDWELSYKESCTYALSNIWGYYADKPIGHHCVQAELQSSDPTVTFLSKSLQFNQNVIPASLVEQVFVIGTKGYGSPSRDKSYHEILLSVDQLPRKYTRDGNFYYPQRDIKDRGSSSPMFSSFGRISAEHFPKGMTEALAVVSRGYLLTNDKLVINGTEYSRAQYIGGFSLEAGHSGPVDKWNLAIAPKELPKNSPPEGCMKRIGSNYIFRIPKDQVVQVAATVEAVEPTNGRVNCCGKMTPISGLMTFAGGFAIWLNTQRVRRKE